MRIITSLAFALIVVGLAVASSSSSTNTSIKEKERNLALDNYKRDESTSYKIEVDEDEINQLLNDFKVYGSKYMSKTKAEQVALMNKLKEAFRNTAAKMILNFGKTIPPLARSWAEVMKYIQVNDKCDQECAIQCLDPKAGCESLYFNTRCLASCNCRFDIEEVEPA